MEALDRFVQILNSLSSVPQEGMGITELTQSTGLSKATLHRILQGMAEHRLVVQVKDTKKYRLGPLSMIWGSQFVLGRDISGILSEYCDLLATETKMYTYLCRFEAEEIYCIYTHQPEQERQQYFVHVGQRLPLYCSASTKAILAFYEEDRVKALLGNEQAKKINNLPAVDFLKWQAEIAEVKKTKVAYCIEELELGVAAISTPIFSASGKALFSMSLVGNAEFIKENKNALSKQVLHIGEKASAHLEAANRLTTAK